VTYTVQLCLLNAAHVLRATCLESFVIVYKIDVMCIFDGVLSCIFVCSYAECSIVITVLSLSICPKLASIQFSSVRGFLERNQSQSLTVPRLRTSLLLSPEATICHLGWPADCSTDVIQQIQLGEGNDTVGSH